MARVVINQQCIAIGYVSNKTPLVSKEYVPEPVHVMPFTDNTRKQDLNFHMFADDT